jgi:hypothetical protein
MSANPAPRKSGFCLGALDHDEHFQQRQSDNRQFGHFVPPFEAGIRLSIPVGGPQLYGELDAGSGFAAPNCTAPSLLSLECCHRRTGFGSAPLRHYPDVPFIKR